MTKTSVITFLEELDEIRYSISEVDSTDFEKQKICMLLKANADDLTTMLRAKHMSSHPLLTIAQIIGRLKDAVLDLKS